MSFDHKPIGIGNLTTNLRKSAENVSQRSLNARKIPTENDFASRQNQNSEEEVAQLAVDVIETNDDLVIIAPLAGVDPDDVRVVQSRSGGCLAAKARPLSEIFQPRAGDDSDAVR